MRNFWDRIVIFLNLPLSAQALYRRHPDPAVPFLRGAHRCRIQHAGGHMEHSLHGERRAASMDDLIDIGSTESASSGRRKRTHQNNLSLCLCWLRRPLSSPQETTCLNRILGKIIPGMKVVFVTFYAVWTVQHDGNCYIYIFLVLRSFKKVLLYI